MSQSRVMSGIESAANVGVGILVSFIFTWLILPIWSITPSAGQAFQITIAYTVLSLVRSYALRRAFNAFARAA